MCPDIRHAGYISANHTGSARWRDEEGEP